MKVREFQETLKQNFEEFFRLKSVRRIIKSHEVQLVSEKKVEIKRKVKDLE